MRRLWQLIYYLPPESALAAVLRSKEPSAKEPPFSNGASGDGTPRKRGSSWGELARTLKTSDALKKRGNVGGP